MRVCLHSVPSGGTEVPEINHETRPPWLCGHRIGAAVGHHIRIKPSLSLYTWLRKSCIYDVLLWGRTGVDHSQSGV